MGREVVAAEASGLRVFGVRAWDTDQSLLV